MIAWDSGTDLDWGRRESVGRVGLVGGCMFGEVDVYR